MKNNHLRIEVFNFENLPKMQIMDKNYNINEIKTKQIGKVL